MRGRQQRRERQRTIALITEYNSCTLECSELATCSLLSSLTRRGKLTFGERQTTRFDNLFLPSRLNLLPFSVRESRAKL